MVQMIPAKQGPVESQAEEVLYKALGGIDGHDDWVIIHSQDLAKVRGKQQSEVDFIVFVPGKGIVVIECKGAHQAIANGSEWTLEGVVASKKHVSPFTQADEAIRSLRGLLKQAGVTRLEQTPFARLVWFPWMSSGDFTQVGSEIKISEIALRAELEKPAKAILRVLDDKIADHKDDDKLTYAPKLFTAADVAAFVSSIRTSIALGTDADALSIDRKIAVRDATDEQKMLVDMLTVNDLLFLEGEAGTGKTAILGELARRWAKEQRKVLYVCYNEMLAEAMNAEMGAHPLIDVYSFNGLMLETVGLTKNPGGSVESWYSETLPGMVLHKAASPDFKREYEAICFDEFQDVTTRPKIFDAVMTLVNDENRATKFAFAADDSQQIQTNGRFADSYQFVLERTPHCTHITLTTNCRQAPKLTAAINKLLSRNSSVKSHRLSKNTDATLEVIATTSDREAKDLKKVLSRLSKTYKNDNIRVLSPRNSQSVLGRLSKMANIHQSELRELKLETDFPKFGGKYHWRSIPKFKGLEEDVVVITDISQETVKWLQSTGQTLERYLYVGLTRARFHAIVLVQDGYFPATHTVDGSPIQTA